MKNTSLTAILTSIILFFSGCQIVETIFKTGFWLGILTVIAVVALIIFLIVKLFQRMK